MGSLSHTIQDCLASPTACQVEEKDRAARVFERAREEKKALCAAPLRPAAAHRMEGRAWRTRRLENQGVVAGTKVPRTRMIVVL